jgi:hypothetical protein
MVFFASRDERHKSPWFSLLLHRQQLHIPKKLPDSNRLSRMNTTHLHRAAGLRMRGLSPLGPKIRLSCFKKRHSDVPACRAPSLQVQALRPTRT